MNTRARTRARAAQDLKNVLLYCLRYTRMTGVFFYVSFKVGIFQSGNYAFGTTYIIHAYVFYVKYTYTGPFIARTVQWKIVTDCIDRGLHAEL